MTAKKTRVLAALLTCPSKTAAAAEAGIGLTTLKRYLADSEFQAAYQKAVSALVEDATRQAQQAIAPALATLREILEDGDETATARIQAARSTLEYALRLTEVADIMKRLDALETGGEYYE